MPPMPPLSRPSTTLYLVRHGLTEWNTIGRFQGHSDVPLSPRGRRQARALAGRLATVPLDAALSSDLGRATETALLALGGRAVPLVADARLREMDLGDLEGLAHDRLRRDFPEVLAGWRDHPSTTRMPGGETLAEVQGRVWPTLLEAASARQGQRLLVVSHGFAILTALCAAIALPLDRFRGLWVDPAGISEIRLGGAQIGVHRVNDTAHLEGLGAPDEALPDGADR